jgi:Type IV secretion system pilin
MYYVLLAMIFATLPLTTHAETTGSLQDLLSGISEFMSSAIIPAILGIAFLAVVWNSVRFFVIGADNEESQQNAKTLAFYSVAAFVFILAFWGIVSMVTSSIGLPSDGTPCEDMRSDYFSKLAPCSSIRPHARPETPASGLVTTPITTTVLPPITGSATTTTSFDINGNPLPPTSGVGSPLTTSQQAGLTALTATLAANKAVAATYTTTKMPNDFGANSPALAAALFADIATGSVIPSLFNNTDRAVALYRLEKIGVISRSAVDSFISQTNQYLGPDATPLTYSSVATLAIIPVTTPAQVANNRTATKAALTAELNDKNINIPVGTIIDVPATINSLYNTSIPVNTRVTTFKALLDDGTITDSTDELYNRFIDDINAEQVLTGIYTTTS